MSATHSLPSEMTIYAAAGLRSTFQEWLRKVPKVKRGSPARNKALVVDAASVVEIDAAGIQLLIALSHSAVAKNRRLELSRPSQALQTACATLGLVAFLLGSAEDIQ